MDVGVTMWVICDRLLSNGSMARLLTTDADASVTYSIDYADEVLPVIASGLEITSTVGCA